MSSSLDFNNTSKFRNELLKRNLQKPTVLGPADLSVQSVQDVQDIDDRKEQDLSANTLKNKYRPESYGAFDNSHTITLDLSKRGLYPLFTTTDKQTLSNLVRGVGVLDNESTMMKESVKHLKRQFQERVRQGGSQFGSDGLSISVDPSKGRPDLFQIIDGSESPVHSIPGNYYRDVNDQTTLMGQLKDNLGVNLNRFIRPSEILVQYMGHGQRSMLFDNLRYSKYRPNYGLGSPLAPLGRAYIGIDSPFDDISLLTNDFAGNAVYGVYNLTQAFGEFIGAKPDFDRTIDNDGDLTGGFTWRSRSINNKLGANNQEWNKDRSNVEASLSTNYTYRDGTIMAKVQELLDTAPKGGAGRSHIGNAIDQTSRVFNQGDKMISKGSAVKYVDKFSGTESGVEYGRVWTKDSPYAHVSDTMKRKGNIRKFTESVLNSPNNLNIAPMNGSNMFEGSTNIGKLGRGFVAKKYMFSIENLAWKTSNRFGFRYDDLPYAERGPNGGRVMWFAPYDLKVSESSSSKLMDNTFLGRIEPIYTYQGAERTGTLSFKVVVDHPSVLNLLTRKRFNGMSDAEVNNYIHAFFAGVEDLDLYDLARKYTQLDKDDLQRVLAYLNGSKDTGEVYSRYREVVGPATEEVSPISNRGIQSLNVRGDAYLYFAQDAPTNSFNYETEYTSFAATRSTTISKFTTAATAEAMSPIQMNADIARINEVFDEATKYFGELQQIITDIKEGLKIGNEVVVKLTGGASQFETSQTNTAKNRCASVKHMILDKLGLPIHLDQAVFEVDYKVDEVTTAKTKLIFKETYKATFYHSRLSGCDCDSETILTKYGGNQDLEDNNPDAMSCRVVYMSVQQTPANTYKLLGVEARQGRTRTVEETFAVGANAVPAIDEVKRILMKLLGEEYYFDALSESSPLVFSSMKEKLKYFHPGFHSTTPEGLNARLTFLQQCTRPGDTIPIIKADGEKNYNDARNTTFGPPPVCVLRLGDLYHSKVMISDVQVTYDDSTWDMNPEGIGFQPMIANVSMNFKFIGGQGLKGPVAELQNALTSNFYANTEMYDPRSTATESREVINKEFLQGMVEQAGLVAKKAALEKPQSIQGNPIGKIKSWDVNSSGHTTGVLDYTLLINDTLDTMNGYNKAVVAQFNNLQKKWGKTVTSMILAEANRKRTSGTFLGSTVKLIGVHDKFTTQPDALIKSIVDDIGNLNFGVFQKIENKLSAAQVAIFQTNYPMQFRDQMQSDIVDAIKSDFRNGEDSLLTLQTKLVDGIDKLNLVNGKVDGTVNKDVVKEFILSASTSNVVKEYFSPHLSKLTDVYTDVQAKLDNTSEASIVEDQDYRANILKTYFTDERINAFMELFGDIGAQKKSKIRDMLTDYLKIKDVTVKEPKSINKINKTVEYAFSQNASTPNAATLQKIFSDKNQAPGTDYNFSKMIK